MEIDLTPILTGSEDIDRDAIYWHYPHYNQHPESFPSAVVRSGNWKLIEAFETGELSLYNLTDDPGETSNLAKELPDKDAGTAQQTKGLAAISRS